MKVFDDKLWCVFFRKNELSLIHVALPSLDIYETFLQRCKIFNLINNSCAHVTRRCSLIDCKSLGSLLHWSIRSIFEKLVTYTFVMLRIAFCQTHIQAL